VREKLEDPAYSGWFLPFAPGGNYSVPACDTTHTPPLCSALYHDQEQTPSYPAECPQPCDCGSVPTGEYLFDHRNASLRQWLATNYTFGPTAMGSPAVKGFFLDDQWSPVTIPFTGYGPFCVNSPIGGPTEIEPNCIANMGLSWEDTLAIAAGWLDTFLAVADAVVAAGGFVWQAFWDTGNGNGTPPADACADFFRFACSADSGINGSALMYQLATPYDTSNDERDVAGFLLIRGEYAWIGWGWVGCSSGNQSAASMYPRPALLDTVQVGTPLNSCSETVPGVSGVFTRNFTQANVAMDCNAYAGSVTPAAGATWRR
jgi:hypothetical protein